MEINILVPYRPLSSGALSTCLSTLRQTEDGKWTGWENEKLTPREYGTEIYRCIKILNKNSYYKHKIKVLIDSDVYPNNSFLKEFDNVEVLKSDYVHKLAPELTAIYRLNTALITGINSVPDEEWICYAYISDLLCPRDWDKPIIDAIEKYGDKNIYVPMFVETKGAYQEGIITTNSLIWDTWRKTICCHALYMPEPAPDGGGFTWGDIEGYIKTATEVNRSLIFERPGVRDYGYYAVLFMKAKHAKAAIRATGPTFDLDFDNRLGGMGLTKAVITNSFVFHPFCEFKDE